jgi:hypothetical protein
VFPRCLLGLPPDQDEGVQSARYLVRNTLWHILLCDNTIQSKERRSDIPVHHAKVSGGSNRTQYPRIRGRHRRHVQQAGRPYSGFVGDLE